MKNRAKMGNRRGNPAYRTPSHFRFQSRMRMTHARAHSGGKRTWQ